MSSVAVGAFGWFMVTAMSTVAVEVGVGGSLMVGVGTYTAGRRIWASAVVVTKLLAESALVSWAGGEVFFSFALASKDCGAIFEHTF